MSRRLARTGDRSTLAWAIAIGFAAACRPPPAGDGDGDTESDTSPTETESTPQPNLPPPTPTLLSPVDGATDVPIKSELCWNLVEDPEGDTVSYRVFVDDIELTQGDQGYGGGYEGPCVGPLTLVHERSYQWQVQAFEAFEPTQTSAKSAKWSFTTEYDGLSKTVFEDPFDEDQGWEVGGDASSGAWVRGLPVGALDAGELAQANRCLGGQSCYFTGQNPGGEADAEDVSGGSTTLTSPPFDLSGAATATVQLARFFYKSELAPGPALRVELLVPDAGEPGGYAVHELELLEAGTANVAENRWTPREYAACGISMKEDTRLRITASDEGDGILEAAIDSVSVHAHDDTTVCAAGEGGICDPAAGASACPDELLCCSKGTLNVGVHRCESAVAGLDFDAPPPSPDSPGNGAMGCDAPDLFIDEYWIQPVFSDIFVSDDTCELLEGCVGGTGWRTIMRFTAAIPNIGSTDLALGIPANNPDVFHYSACHSHFHFDDFAVYELRDGDGVVATGHKQAFCLLDTISWAWPPEIAQFDCANQGISRGWSDFYESDLPCQWVDVTDVMPGDYDLRLRLNDARPDAAFPLLNERDYSNNVLEVPVSIPRGGSSHRVVAVRDGSGRWGRRGLAPSARRVLDARSCFD